MPLLDAITGAPNAGQPLPWLVTCGQPSEAQLEAAAARGLAAVIDLRDPMEARPFDEPATLERLGIAYRNIPVNAGALDDAMLERVLDAVREFADQPTMLHCASANRVGGALLPYFINDRQMEEQAAIDAAMKVGLRSAELLDWGLDYARRHRP